MNQRSLRQNGAIPRTLAGRCGLALILALCLVATGAAAEVTLGLSDLGEVPFRDAPRLELTGQGVTGMGALQFEVHFPPRLLSFWVAEAGRMMPDALLEAKQVSPGRIKVAIACNTPVAGDGPLVTLKFFGAQTVGKALLMMDKMKAWDDQGAAMTIRQTQVMGSVDLVNPRAWLLWTIGGGGGGLLLLLLLWFFFGRRRAEPLAPVVLTPPPGYPGCPPAAPYPTAPVAPAAPNPYAQGTPFPPPGAVCPHCRAALFPDAPFCAQCGQKVPPPAPPAAAGFCSQCGKPLKAEMKFCAGCGAKVLA